MKPVLTFMHPANYRHEKENSSLDVNMGRSIKYG